VHVWHKAGDEGLKASGARAFQYVPGELLVKFREGTEKETVREISSRLDLRAIRMVTGQPLYLMKIGDGASVEEVIERLESYPEVEHSEPNYEDEMQQ
jgi:hypothetical protein